MTSKLVPPIPFVFFRLPSAATAGRVCAGIADSAADADRNALILNPEASDRSSR